MEQSPRYYAMLDYPEVQVQYHVQVKDAATGAIVPCGSSAPAGSELVFEFAPHEYQDVYWFGTGTTWDSPYGDWNAAAALPTTNMCVQKNKFYQESFQNNLTGYASLSTNPPDENISGLDRQSCAGPSNARSCTMTAAGTANAVFDFAPTNARFYYGYEFDQDGRQCHVFDQALVAMNGGQSDNFIFFYSNSAEYSERALGGHAGYQKGAGASDPVTVFEVQVPAQSISCPITIVAANGNNPPSTPTLISGGQCVVGTPHTLSMVSSDPDNDNLKYGIDWDGSGSVDQWIPGSGFVASGSTQTASRTYAIPGSKTVKVLAQDTNGLSSGWATLSFNCADSATAALNENDTNVGDDAGGTAPTSLLPDLDLRVIPSLVKSGNTTKVNWSATNVTSCTVSGENGDAWSGLLSALGGNISKPITGETTYTLSCLALDGATITKSATVRIIPTFQEL
jgi:hypothetical protein